MRRNILITASTGNQGSALINALQPLLHPPSLTHAHNSHRHPAQNLNSSFILDCEHEYHIFVLTRSASSPRARALTAISSSITIVEGDLDDAESISRIFNEVKACYGGIWGVFACLPYPGLGKAADGEERQGKSLTSMALKHGVECFVNSSSARAGPRFEFEGPIEDARASWNGERLRLSQRAKSRIERHIEGLGERGLPWTIIRPSFLMENFDGLRGRIAFSVLKHGLNSDTTIGLTATTDIGKIAAGILANHRQYTHATLTLLSSQITPTTIFTTHVSATGYSHPSLHRFIAILIKKFNHGIRDQIKELESFHHARSSGAWPGLENEIARANEICALMGFEEWVVERARKGGEGGEEAEFRIVSFTDKSNVWYFCMIIHPQSTPLVRFTS